MQTAREAAAKAARVNAVGVLATSLVHELAQPLNAAAFLGQAMRADLERSQADPTADKLARVEQLLGRAEDQLARATGIVDRVRDFLRQQAISSQPLEVDALIERAMGLIGWFARQRDVVLKFNSGTAGVWLRGDATQLEQVLVNLICNGVQAIDGSDAQTRQVTIETQTDMNNSTLDGQTHDAASLVRITVRDSGPGLDRESAAALFDLFASKRSAGLGMGLPISRDIVESHGGKLWADLSATGGLFHFTLPRANPGEH
jgi:signal transduction histidine kinase